MTYRRDIDGLRAVAVLLVLLFHAFPKLVPGGYIGVDIFFVISGYLITGIIVGPLQDGTFSVREFYRRRVRRIFPALVVLLAGALALGYLILSPPELKQMAKHTVAAAAFVSNIAYWREAGYFDTAAETKPLLHLWSLGVEEQFYIVWPAVLFTITRLRLPLRPTMLLLATVSFGGCIYAAGSTAAFYAPYLRAWELLLGGLLTTVTFRHQYASLVGIGLIAAAVVLLTPTSTFPGWWALLPTIGAVGVLASDPEAPVNRLLSNPVFVAIGLISYPLYLWHWPLLSFASIDALGEPSIATRLLCLAGAFALAGLTYLAIESRFRRARSWRPAYGLVMGMVAMAGVGLFTAHSEGFANRTPATIQSVLAYMDYVPSQEARANVCWLPYEKPFRDYAPECFLRPEPGGVVVWGDSHAARLYVGVRGTLGANANIAQFTRDSCPPLVGTAAGDACEEGNRAVVDQITKSKPATVVMFGLWPSWTGEQWAAADRAPATSMANTLDALHAAGVPRVIVVGPAPRWRKALPLLLYDEWEGEQVVKERLIRGGDTDVPVVDARVGAIARAHNAEYVSLIDLMCNADGCLTSLPGEPGKLMTWDYGHFTTDGARWVTDSFLKKR